MRNNCNGYKKVEKEKQKKAGGCNGLSSFGDIKISGKEDINDTFRGFVKVPQLKVPKIDIKPSSSKNGRPRSRKKGNSLNKIHKHRLSQQCTVKLLRDDLEKLKASIKNSSSDSESTNPSDMIITCRICKKSYTSIKKLQNHQENKHIILKSRPQKRVSFSDHVIIHEVKEYHKCRKCTKIFDNFKSLKHHMRLQHKKRNCYICNYCNKSFADRLIFKIHIKLHCDVCGELLPNKTKYLEHRRDICRVLKHKCKVCNIKFFNIIDLKDHSYEHTYSTYVCDICKDKFQSKCMITHHITFLHLNQQLPSYNTTKISNKDVYTCNFCNEMSVKKDDIEKHSLILTNTVKFNCDQCTEEFKTEQDMLQHKWTHFLSNNSRKIKTTYNINEELPEYMKPVIKLVKLKESELVKETEKVNNDDKREPVLDNIKDLEAPIIDRKSKKTIVSQYYCETCGKYFSRKYNLTRHISEQHSDYENLKCKVCEETFVWPSLLRRHKCIRLHHREMHFDDARPEIQIENLHQFDDSLDFEIPAPIVELTECDSVVNVIGDSVVNVNGDSCEPLSGFKVVMQEVPIEF